MTIGKAELEITTPLDQNLPWDGFANVTLISNYSGRDECFVRIEGWLKECSRNHQSRDQSSVVGTDTVCPKRLIDTGPLDDDSALRLIDHPDAHGQTVKYCALSYCWGREWKEK